MTKVTLNSSVPLEYGFPSEALFLVSNIFWGKIYCW